MQLTHKTAIGTHTCVQERRLDPGNGLFETSEIVPSTTSAFRCSGRLDIRQLSTRCKHTAEGMPELDVAAGCLTKQAHVLQQW